MPKKIIVIGAGIAGLSAGCYARMNGYDAEIYEMHDKAGGLCTHGNVKVILSMAVFIGLQGQALNPVSINSGLNSVQFRDEG
jgi:phytoene dehydrogenase-like protein